WVLLIGGVIWIGPLPGKWLHNRKPSPSRFAAGKAIIVIQFRKPDPVIFDPAATESEIRSSEWDLNTFVAILRSSMISRRALASLGPDEFSRVLGPKFISTGKTTFGGVRIESMRKDGEPRLTIVSSHRDPDAARLVAERLYAELIKYLREFSAGRNEYAVTYLREMRERLANEAKKAEAELFDARRSQDSNSIHAAETAVRVAGEAVRAIDERLASTAESTKNPVPLPFHVTEARLVTGPFWNRTETDFTAEVAQLENR
ncbi:MAG TPA: hypothetical protein VK477_00085, partial [Acidobacteriota bacterium]|nr:hypothetical protein [Acidobacteriota bacterium]